MQSFLKPQSISTNLSRKNKVSKASLSWLERGSENLVFFRLFETSASFKTTSPGRRFFIFFLLFFFFFLFFLCFSLVLVDSPHSKSSSPGGAILLSPCSLPLPIHPPPFFRGKKFYSNKFRFSDLAI